MPNRDPSAMGPRDKEDQDRLASMAYEGGVAAAEMDMREQLETLPRGRIKKRRRIPWMWGAAAASAAVSGIALARTVVARRIAKLRGKAEEGRAARGTQGTDGKQRGGSKRRAPRKQRTATMPEHVNGNGAAKTKTRARRSPAKKSRQASAASARKSARGKHPSVRH